MISPTDSPPLSIVIPIYNKVDVVASCLRTNLKHCGMAAEWILIDNNSDAATKSFLFGFAQEIEAEGHVVNLITEKENTGVAKAWNTGLWAARGEFLVILNNDCILEPGWGYKLLDGYDHHPFEVFSPFIVERHYLSKAYSYEDYLNELPLLRKRNQKALRRGFFGGVVIAGPKSIFEELDGFDPVYWLSMEDMDFEMRALQAGHAVGMVGSVLGYHYGRITRRELDHEEEYNMAHFQDKFGWDFRKAEQKSINKRIRSLNKWIWKLFRKMSPINQQYPVDFN